jgi:hypothetical protein
VFSNLAIVEVSQLVITVQSAALTAFVILHVLENVVTNISCHYVSLQSLLFTYLWQIQYCMSHIAFNYHPLEIYIFLISEVKYLFYTEVSCIFISYLWFRNGVFIIENRYILDGPWVVSRWPWGFPHPSISALGPTQPTARWVICCFPEGKTAGT